MDFLQLLSDPGTYTSSGHFTPGYSNWADLRQRRLPSDDDNARISAHPWLRSGTKLVRRVFIHSLRVCPKNHGQTTEVHMSEKLKNWPREIRRARMLDLYTPCEAHRCTYLAGEINISLNLVGVSFRARENYSERDRARLQLHGWIDDYTGSRQSSTPYAPWPSMEIDPFAECLIRIQ